MQGLEVPRHLREAIADRDETPRGPKRLIRFGHRQQFRPRVARIESADRRPVERRQRCPRPAAVWAEARGNPWL